MADQIRILLADDHPVVRDGLAAVLSTQPDFLVVGEAGTGSEALRLAVEELPDVVLLDLAMPEMDGVEVMKRLRDSYPAAGVIVFTAFDTDDRIVDAVKAGARGYLLKGAPREEIFNAVRVVHAGGSLLQPLVASRLLRYLSGRFAPSSGAFSTPGSSSPSSPQAGDQRGVTLTMRELEVLDLLARGLQNKEIAATLQISERTAKFHVNGILRKLGASNRTECLAIAAKRGLINL